MGAHVSLIGTTDCHNRGFERSPTLSGKPNYINSKMLVGREGGRGPQHNTVRTELHSTMSVVCVVCTRVGQGISVFAHYHSSDTHSSYTHKLPDRHLLARVTAITIPQLTLPRFSRARWETGLGDGLDSADVKPVCYSLLVAADVSIR